MESIVPQLINGLLAGSIYALIALGLTMTFGILGVVNFAHGEIMMVGSYVAFIVAAGLGVNFFIALVIAILAVAALGWIIERSTFRYTRELPMNGLIMSIGLVAIIQNGVMSVFGVDVRSIRPTFPESISLFGASFAGQRLFAFLLIVGLMIGFQLFLKRVKTGKGIRAVAQNSEAAALMGINVDRVMLFSFVIGAALAGIAGALVATMFIVTPFIGVSYVLKGFVVIVLGGLGSIPGAILGAFILGIVESFGAGYISTSIKDGFGFALLLLVLFLRPSGLLGRQSR
ncbi:MAG: branched-chain amino acid ABC transporter permease [Chloroflexota bacterium]|nr:MAG: branched-chain amino acid ABC transporter permease [Chloroflexota bacterium]